MKKILVLAAMVFYALAVNKTSNAGLIFSENFGSLSNNATITTSNTDFTYVRSGTGGSVVALNPSNFGSGSSLNLGGSSGGSLTGVGVQTGLGSNRLIDFSLDLRAINGTTGTLVMLMGSGNTFTTNNTFANNDLFFGLQITSGALQYRVSNAWSNVTGGTITQDIGYNLRVVANGTANSVSYGISDLVGASRMDIYLDGVLIGNDLSFTNLQDASGFRIYQVNSSRRFEIDNISISNSVSSVPEPSALLLVGSIIGTGLLRRRRA